MIWKIEYSNGNIVDEKKISFSQADKENIKRVYFFNNVDFYGLDVDNLCFFVNKHVFDLKLSGTINKFIQYKTATYNLKSNVNVVASWNIGVEIVTDFGLEKYIMSILPNKKVYLEATRFLGEIREEKKRIQIV